jgi:hypothetical protein
MPAFTMAKFKLDLEPDPEVLLIAISSHVNDYRLCWSLNIGLGLQLVRRTEDIQDNGPEGLAHYCVFDQPGMTGEPAWSLVANHAPDGVLVPEQRQADFFLVMGTDTHQTPEDILHTVRSTQFVLAAYILEANTLKSAHKLLQ